MTIAGSVAGNRAETSAGVVAYHDEGEGPAVLLLHGFPASSWQWRELMPLLAGRFRVIAPDLPGAGASIPVDDVVLDLATHASAMHELMTRLRIDRFAAVGHGVGAGVAQLLALDDDSVEALVLLNAATLDAWPGSDVGLARERLHAHRPTPELVRGLVLDAFEAGALPRDRLPDGVLDAYAEPYATGDGPSRFARVVEGLDGIGLAERGGDLASIGVPALILWGEDDPIYPSSIGERLNDAMPSSTLALFPGCGHFLVEEAADTVGPMISGYLRSRYSGDAHAHGDQGVVMLQLERRPPWVDLEHDERDDWFEPDQPDQPDQPDRPGA